MYLKFLLKFYIWGPLTSFLCRPLIKYPGKREITIFNLLSVYVKEPSDAKSFVEILLIFLAKKRLNFG